MTLAVSPSPSTDAVDVAGSAAQSGALRLVIIAWVRGVRFFESELCCELQQLGIGYVASTVE